MPTQETRRVARAYFDAWTSAQGSDAVRPLMEPEFLFDAGITSIESRDEFLAAGGWPKGASTSMLSAAYDGEHAFQLYEAVNGQARVKVAEHLTVREGVVASSEIVVICTRSEVSWRAQRRCRHDDRQEANERA
jgi:hypothetical protein